MIPSEVKGKTIRKEQRHPVDYKVSNIDAHSECVKKHVFVCLCAQLPRTTWTGNGNWAQS